MTSKDIRIMSEDELLDMDYFLNDLDDGFGEEGFYIFKPSIVCCYARLRAGPLI